MRRIPKSCKGATRFTRIHHVHRNDDQRKKWHSMPRFSDFICIDTLAVMAAQLLYRNTIQTLEDDGCADRLQQLQLVEGPISETHWASYSACVLVPMLHWNSPQCQQKEGQSIDRSMEKFGMCQYHKGEGADTLFKPVSVVYSSI